LFADALTTGQNIYVGYGDGESGGTIAIETIIQNYATTYPWVLKADVDSQTLEAWSRGKELVFTLQVGTEETVEERQKYLLPNEKRAESLGSFIRDCFPDHPTRKP
jgi:hypothetical protein